MWLAVLYCRMSFTADFPSKPPVNISSLQHTRYNFHYQNDVLTKYKDVVVHHSSSESRSSRGQWISQSPGPPGLQNLCGLQLAIIPSSSNEEDLHDHDPVSIYRYSASLCFLDQTDKTHRRAFSEQHWVEAKPQTLQSCCILSLSLEQGQVRCVDTPPWWRTCHQC